MRVLRSMTSSAREAESNCPPELSECWSDVVDSLPCHLRSRVSCSRSMCSRQLAHSYAGPYDWAIHHRRLASQILIRRDRRRPRRRRTRSPRRLPRPVARTSADLALGHRTHRPCRLSTGNIGNVYRPTGAELAEIVSGDLARPVPTCPEWTFRQLATHVGRGHRGRPGLWPPGRAEAIPLRQVPDGKLPDEPARHVEWLNAAAAGVIAAVTAVGGIWCGRSASLVRALAASVNSTWPRWTAALILAADRPAYQGRRPISAGFVPVASSSAVPGGRARIAAGSRMSWRRSEICSWVRSVAVAGGTDRDVVLADQQSEVAVSRGESAPAPTRMTAHEAGDRVAQLLLLYCRRDLEDSGGPDHETGWWFTDAPPDVAREALTVAVGKMPGERANDQPPEEWLVAQAERRGGVLAGFAAPKRLASPRMGVDPGGCDRRAVLAGRGPGRRARAAVAGRWLPRGTRPRCRRGPRQQGRRPS